MSFQPNTYHTAPDHLMVDHQHLKKTPSDSFPTHQVPDPQWGGDCGAGGGDLQEEHRDQARHGRPHLLPLRHRLPNCISCPTASQAWRASARGWGPCPWTGLVQKDTFHSNINIKCVSAGTWSGNIGCWLLHWESSQVVFCTKGLCFPLGGSQAQGEHPASCDKPPVQARPHRPVLHAGLHGSDQLPQLQRCPWFLQETGGSGSFSWLRQAPAGLGSTDALPCPGNPRPSHPSQYAGDFKFPWSTGLLNIHYSDDTTNALGTMGWSRSLMTPYQIQGDQKKMPLVKNLCFIHFKRTIYTKTLQVACMEGSYCI